METLDGKKVNLAEKYKGKVVLLVNVASKCGSRRNTSNSKRCTKSTASRVWRSSACRATNSASKSRAPRRRSREFCEKNYGVKFDMLGKVDVNGEEAAPLYKYLTSKEIESRIRRQNHLELREVPVQSRWQGRRPLRAQDQARCAGSREGD